MDKTTNHTPKKCSHPLCAVCGSNRQNYDALWLSCVGPKVPKSFSGTVVYVFVSPWACIRKCLNQHCVEVLHARWQTAMHSKCLIINSTKKGCLFPSKWAFTKFACPRSAPNLARHTIRWVCVTWLISVLSLNPFCCFFFFFKTVRQRGSVSHSRTDEATTSPNVGNHRSLQRWFASHRPHPVHHAPTMTMRELWQHCMRRGKTTGAGRDLARLEAHLVPWLWPSAGQIPSDNLEPTLAPRTTSRSSG